jgi:hypothetical protein
MYVLDLPNKILLLLYISLCSIVKTTEWNGPIEIDKMARYA